MRAEGIRLGADQGLKTVLSLSSGAVTPDMVIRAPKKGYPDRTIKVNLDSITEKMANKKKGSRAFARTAIERKNYVNYALNRINLDGAICCPR